MPIYEYICERCGEDRVTLVYAWESEPSTCPVCEGPLTKKVSIPAVVFKGGGWSNEGYAKDQKADSKADSGTQAEGGQA